MKIEKFPESSFREVPFSEGLDPEKFIRLIENIKNNKNIENPWTIAFIIFTALFLIFSIYYLRSTPEKREEIRSLIKVFLSIIGIYIFLRSTYEVAGDMEKTLLVSFSMIFFIIFIYFLKEILPRFKIPRERK